MILLIIDMLIIMVFSECYIRMFIPVKNVCYDHDPILGDTYCPNQRTFGYVEDNYYNILLTNSIGFHDYHHEIGENGKLKIQFYGDSMTGAIGVPIDDTIPSVVEKEMGSDQFEVMNMSSPEDSTIAQYLVYENIGYQFSPDAVVVLFMCDFDDNIIETHYKTRSPYLKLDDNNNFVFIAPEKIDMETFLARLKKKSHFYRFAANKVLSSKLYYNVDTFFKKRKLIQSRNKSNNNYDDVRKSLIKNKSWPITTSLLKAFRKKVNEDGGIFILIDGQLFVEKCSGCFKNNDLKEFCKQNSISYISVYDAIEELKLQDRSSYFFEDGHLNSIGNQIIAKEISTKLLKIFVTVKEK